jgi:hypothetical protein
MRYSLDVAAYRTTLFVSVSLLKDFGVMNKMFSSLSPLVLERYLRKLLKCVQTWSIDEVNLFRPGSVDGSVELDRWPVD